MTSRCIFGGLIGVLLAGCAQTGAYRSDNKLCSIEFANEQSTEAQWKSQCQSPRLPCSITLVNRQSTGEQEKSQCPKARLVEILGNHPYKLAYVEIDEQGVLADRRQVDAALEF